MLPQANWRFQSSIGAPQELPLWQPLSPPRGLRSKLVRPAADVRQAPGVHSTNTAPDRPVLRTCAWHACQVTWTPIWVWQLRLDRWPGARCGAVSERTAFEPRREDEPTASNSASTRRRLQTELDTKPGRIITMGFLSCRPRRPSSATRPIGSWLLPGPRGAPPRGR
jgi:hypothetical protein